MSGPVIRASNLQFFLARADEARAEADAATLDHVRERCRRSEAAWTELADKARRTERLRLQEQERKAAIAASSINENLIEHEIQHDGPKSPDPAPERGSTLT